MFSIQQILTLFLTLTMELNLTACGAEGTTQPTPEMPEPPAQVQETPEPAPAPSPEPELEVTEGTETYRGIQMGNVLHARRGTFIITSMSRTAITAAKRMLCSSHFPVMRDCTSRAWGEAYIARTLLLRH